MNYLNVAMDDINCTEDCVVLVMGLYSKFTYIELFSFRREDFDIIVT